MGIVFGFQRPILGLVHLFTIYFYTTASVAGVQHERRKDIFRFIIALTHSVKGSFIRRRKILGILVVKIVKDEEFLYRARRDAEGRYVIYAQHSKPRILMFTLSYMTTF
jgi:hypothetical protein